MKTIQFIITALLIAFSGLLAKAQSSSDSVKITYKNKTVAVKPLGDESTTTIKFKDTVNNKKIVVKVSYTDDISNPSNTMNDKIDSGGKKVIDMLKYKNNKQRNHFIETYYLPTIDIGFVSTMSDNNAATSYQPKLSKSANINIGLIRQDMNLYNNQILLSYGLNVNNYYLKYKDKQQVQYLDQNGYLKVYNDSINNYDKNRLDVRYLTVPVMLEFHGKNNRFNLAAGVEFGFNGRSTAVLKGDRNALDLKQKNDIDIKINETQMNAVVRVEIDNISVYGRYSLSNMYTDSAFAQGQNPGQHLFSFGVCLFGI
ncbi:MAG: outer membrane beta-barrel protein [Chitinophagaceae bacterium]